MDTAQYWFQAASDYQIERSLRFNSVDSAYLSRTFGGSATSLYTYTISAWVKRSNTTANIETIFGVGTGSAIATTWLGFNSDTLAFAFNDGTHYIASSAVYRDLSAWYHIVAAVDTTQATASNRVKLYVNGAQITALGSANYPEQNTGYQINDANLHVLGARYRTSIDGYFNGYITETHFIDGQALTPSSFGETDTITGVWKPKKYSGTYGTNGFYLNFADNSGTTSTTLGKDSSGNGNNWTPNNFSVTAGSGNDSLIDTPTPYADGGNGRGNYCTLNPIVALSGRTTLSEGNLQTLGTNSSESGVEYGTIQVSSGKWYWENTVLALSTSASYPAFGVGRTLVNNSNSDAPGFESGGAAIFTSGAIYKESSLITTVSTYTTNDIIGVALDVDNLTCAFYKNGTLLTTVTGLTAGSYFATIGSYYNSSTAVNFGQRPFAYTPPSGFLALNTQNLPEPTIEKPSNYMSVVTDTGANILTAAQGKLLTGAGLIWIKDRANANNHQLLDTVRGGTLTLQSNTTGQETTYSAPSGSSVAWCWSKSAVSGFDIVTFTGTGATQNVSHSLGVAPKMVLVKSRGATGDWWVYHESIGATKTLFLSLTDAALTFSAAWNNTAPTSSVFTVGAGSGLNANGVTQVAYLWSEVTGFSKFGSYTGNGSSDGPFVFCGFRPRWVMIKRSDSTSGWHIYDTARSACNVNTVTLAANLADSESSFTSGYDLDVLSNGFKARTGPSIAINASGGTYIFAAFAESPFKYSLAR